MGGVIEAVLGFHLFLEDDNVRVSGCRHFGDYGEVEVGLQNGLPHWEISKTGVLWWEKRRELIKLERGGSTLSIITRNSKSEGSGVIHKEA